MRLLLYLLVLLVCASLAPRAQRLAWGIRGVALAIAAICVAGLVSRLRPDLLSKTGVQAARLDFPITYWNGMGIIAAVGVILALHLTASSREPWPVRVLAAGLVPIAACTVYLTLSRGGIAAGARAGRLPDLRLLARHAGRAAGDPAAGGGRADADLRRELLVSPDYDGWRAARRAARC